MGAPCLPPRVHAVNDSLNAEYELTALVSRNLQMEKDLEKLKRDHACAVGECHEAHNKIKDLEAKLTELSIKEENLDDTIKDTLENEAKQLSIESLAKHKRAVHEGVKYSCGQCCQQFSLKGSLALHKRAIHEGVKYTCTQCGKQLSRKSKLSQHQKTVHKGIKSTTVSLN